MFPEETLGKISYVECFPSIFAFLLSNAASITVTCCETKGRRSTIKAEIRVIKVNLTNAKRKELWNLFGTKKAAVLSLPRGSLIWTLIFSISISYKPDQYHCLLFEI